MRKSRRLIRRPTVRDRTGLSDSTLHRRIRAGEFPAPVQIGPNAVAWFEDEVDAYLDNLPRANLPAPRGRAA